MFARNFLISISITILSISAFGSEVRMGLLHSPKDEKNENGLNINIEYIHSLSNKLLGADVLIGSNINVAGYTSSIYTGLVWQKIFKNNIFISASFGGAIHDGRLQKSCTRKTKGRALGSRLLFRENIDIGYSFGERKISLFIDHISNANIVPPNSGVTNIGVRYSVSL